MLRTGVRIPIAILFVCLAGISTLAAAQKVGEFDKGAGGGNIRGQIIVPVPGFWDYIDVILEYETGIPVAYTHTDSVGNFAFNNLPMGRYFINIDLTGFDKVRERVDVQADFPTLPQRLILVPEGERAAAIAIRSKYPKKAWDEYEKAQDELKKGDLAKSIQRLNNAIKESPAFFEAHLLLGTVHYKMKKMVEAEVAYRKARELDPKSAQAMMNLGQLYIETAESSVAKDPAAAAKVFSAAYDLLSDAVRLAPSSVTASFLLGVASYKSNRNDEAETNLKHALALDRKMGQAQVMLANVYLRKQNWEGALNTLDAYLKEHPNAPDAKPIQETRAKVAERLKAGAK